MQVTTASGGARMTGWIRRGEVEQLDGPPGVGGGCYGEHGRGFGRRAWGGSGEPPKIAYKGPAEIAVGTTVYAQRGGGGAWATVVGVGQDARFGVVVYEGEEWAEVKHVPGVGGTEMMMGRAWVRVGAVRGGRAVKGAMHPEPSMRTRAFGFRRPAFRSTLSPSRLWEVPMTPDLERLGELVANLPPMVVTESLVSATPPGGSGRLLGIEDGKFKWQPIAEKDWLALKPQDRAAIIIERAEAWLQENGDHVSVPIAFVDPSAADPSAENIFGGITSTIKEAICATYRLLHSNPANAELAILGISMTILAIMGLVPPDPAPLV